MLHKDIRRTGFAVRAFNIEVATIQDQITDLKIGEMRFKFWETSLAEIYKDKIPKHPVLIELYTVSILVINLLELVKHVTYGFCHDLLRFYE